MARSFASDAAYMAPTVGDQQEEVKGARDESRGPYWVEGVPEELQFDDRNDWEKTMASDESACPVDFVDDCVGVVVRAVPKAAIVCVFGTVPTDLDLAAEEGALGKVGRLHFGRAVLFLRSSSPPSFSSSHCFSLIL